MRFAQVLAAIVCITALPVQGQARETVQLKLYADPQVAELGFRIVLVEFPNPQLRHCRGTKILELNLTGSGPSPTGGGRIWSQTVDVGPRGEGRTDSLVLCYPEGERLKPLWDGRIRTPEGKRLIGLDCKVREGYELTCDARYSLSP